MSGTKRRRLREAHPEPSEPSRGASTTETVARPEGSAQAARERLLLVGRLRDDLEVDLLPNGVVEIASFARGVRRTIELAPDDLAPMLFALQVARGRQRGGR